MSLDVGLYGELYEIDCECPNCYTVHKATKRNCLFNYNITHNLNVMAGEAGIYKHLWRPDEIGIVIAAQLIDPLREGLALLKSDPERFKVFNPSNGWGDYDGLVAFVQKYLAACIENPEATVEASR